MKTTLIKTRLGMLMLGGLSLMATAAQADWNRNGHPQVRHAYQQSQAYSQQINTRQARQMDRIEAGNHNGSLTRHEVRDLMREQHEIQAMERHFRADGIIDAREFQRLDHALNQADRNIRAERHDRQARYAYNTRPR
ncbi:MAG: hypothetical protein K0M39_12525 [Rhizobium sp.]|jgi:uncharacterized membrane protein YebE (DUF533 family)|uniref:hypothetical protein n=1 Tax=Thiobacillus sp. TaxID=924 RepID=UPI0025EDC65F|nr:hypothetical protein [Thiobacillus sp.]MBW8365367.1 hypothetical protein [Rhizobium sp.]